MEFETIKKIIENDLTVKDIAEFKKVLKYLLQDTESEFKQYIEIKSIEDNVSFQNAKTNILKTIFSKYLDFEIKDFQKLVSSHEDTSSDVYINEINEVNRHIKEIAKLSRLFDDVEISFVDFLQESIEEINVDEIIAIFYKFKVSEDDLKLIENTINSTLKSSIIHKPEDYFKDFINHELMDLIGISRKKSNIFQPENFDKFKELATALIEHKTFEKIEGMDGGLAYLISLDLVYGLNDIKNSQQEEHKIIAKLLNDAVNNNFNSSSLDILMREAIVQSKNIKENFKGVISPIINSGNTLRSVGPADRIFDFEAVKFFIHTVSSNCTSENSQLGRTLQIHNEENKIQSGIQIGDKPPINRKLNDFSEMLPTISRREQVLLSHMRNFSYVVSLISMGKLNIESLNQSPLEIWSTALNASRSYMNDYLKVEDKINEVGNAWLYILDKYKVFDQTISTNNADGKHEHFINPFFNFANAVIELYESDNLKYQTLLGNIVNTIKNKEQFLNGHVDVIQKYKSLTRTLKGMAVDNPELNKQDFSKISLAADVYCKEDSPLYEIILANENNQQELINKIKKHFSKESFTFSKLNDEEVEAFANLPETTKIALIPTIRQFAESDLQSVYETEHAKNKISLYKPIFDSILDENANQREFIGGNNPYTNTESENLLYRLYANPDRMSSKQESTIEILSKTSEMYGATLKKVQSHYYTIPQQEAQRKSSLKI